MQEFAGGLDGPVGAIALDDGSLLVVEQGAGALTRVGAEGDIDRLANCGGRPCGAALGPGGKVFLCNGGDPAARGGEQADAAFGRIQVADLLSGDVFDLYTRCEGRLLDSPCDLVFDGFGGFYFTDSGSVRGEAGLFYARDDGSQIRRLAATIDQPAGIGLSPSGSHLLAAEASTGRILTWEIDSPGLLGEMTPVGTVSPPVRLASLAIELDGAVAVASNPADGHGEAGITVVLPSGELAEFLPLPDAAAVTDLCFGGVDLRTAYITTLGPDRIYAVRWARPGLSLVSEPTAAE